MRRAHGCPRLPILVELVEITRARPGQPAGGVTLVDSRGLHAFCAPPHTLLVQVLVPYIYFSVRSTVLQLQQVGRFSYCISGAAGVNNNVSYLSIVQYCYHVQPYVHGQ